jgi:fructan beta-fructosidase
MPAHSLSLLACSFILATALGAAQTSYQEPYRPQVHFSPREHWTNDPNGLVYFDGEYHLFFQFNPLGNQWGHMSWGHAVSSDLLHWNELPVAIPEKDGEMVFTGSVVVDSKNTSGFCAPGKECLVAIYTGHRHSPQQTLQTQNLAYSVDDGRTWTRYVGNPVLDLHMADFRDPSVRWDEKEAHWRMAVSLPTEHKIRFYASPDLKRWTQLSDFGPAGDVDGDWECPDLLHIPDGNGSGDVWALKVGLNPGAPQGGSGEQYFLGHFDGKHFVASHARGSHGWTNYGKDDYCAISFNGLPRGEKPVLIGWMNSWQYAAQLPTSPWRGQMSIPRRLSIRIDQAGMAIKQEPISDPLRAEHTPIGPSQSGEISIQEPPFELNLQFGHPSEEIFGIRLYTDEQHWTEIGFDRLKREFYFDRKKSSIAITPDFPTKTIAPLPENRPYDLKLIVDRSSIEAYAQDGTIAMTNVIFPPSDNSRLVFFSASGKPVAVKGDIWKLHTIWERNSGK